ncbi:peptidase [Anabaena lutea]|uniref:Peptidase n=1 Tax=Anabaena lutea FACHB-196 TaxID=2692881 RepID=A0ABR8FGF2_9NOST|nr:peptidase [Anabaena lutea]MBD2569233.1 peptidase [Anabaena lutea FACHB-196]
MGKITQNLISKTRTNLVLQRLLAVLTLAIMTGLLIICTNFQTRAVVNSKFRDVAYNISTSYSLEEKFIQKVHPLPSTLASWENKTNSGDYFDKITPTEVGYLIWSSFPVRVKIEIPTGISAEQSQLWVNNVLQAVQEWSVYLPLEVVEKAEIADIQIFRKAPPLQIEPNSKIPRARSALTSYETYTNINNILLHRFTILLSPNQTGEYAKAAARHELGHALGIWGHSPLQTDVLYFSQVRKPPSISARDVNTLKRIYEQPTSLGW